MYDEIDSRRLCELVVDAVQQQILMGTLADGDRLPSEHELATTFGMSRTVIREALRILVEQGLVLVHPGRGAFVASSDQRPLQRTLSWLARMQGPEGDAYLLEMRQLLEPGVCALAAERAQDEVIRELGELITAADAAAGDPDAFVTADMAFHRLIGESSGNPLICAVLDSVGDLLRSQRLRYFSVLGAPERAQRHHRRILSSLERRAAGEALRAMHEHLLQVELDIRGDENLH